MSNVEKLYTQTQVNSIVQERLNKFKRSFPTKEQMEQYRKWKENQIIEEQKHIAELNTARDACLAAEKRAYKAEVRVACLSHGVCTQYIEDVITLAEKLVSKNRTFSEAVQCVTDKYPIFRGVNNMISITTYTK